MDACEICGTQEDVNIFIWQGRDGYLCFECWDYHVGDGRFDELIEDEWSDFDAD